MKKSKRMLCKFLLLTSSALLLVSLTMGVTLAYLTDTDEVDNTFTVGNVAITLDEASIGADGDATTGDRVKKNEYHLLHGHKYHKDPTVHVDEKSEDGWLFVKLEKENNFDDFMTYQMAAGWIELENGVYYCTVTSDTADQTFGVILDDTVNVKQTVTKGQLNALTDNILPKMSVTA